MSRQLDMAIANLFGIKRETMVCEGAIIETVRIPAYSTDGKAMLELGKAMRKRGYELAVVGDRDGKYCAYTTNLEGATVNKWTLSTSEPLARAMEAYRQLTGEQWEEPK